MGINIYGLVVSLILLFVALRVLDGVSKILGIIVSKVTEKISVKYAKLSDTFKHNLKVSFWSIVGYTIIIKVLTTPVLLKIVVTTLGVIGIVSMAGLLIVLSVFAINKAIHHFVKKEVTA